MTRRMDRRAASIALGVVLSIICGLTIVIMVAQVININIDKGTGAWILRGTFVMIIFSAVMFGSIAFHLVYFGVSDVEHGSPISRLFAAVLSFALFLFAYFCLIMLNALDYLSNDLRPHWDFVRQPEVRLVNVGLIVGIVASFAFFHVSVMRTRRWGKRAIIGWYAGMITGSALIVLAATLWSLAN